MSDILDNTQKAQVLVEALPYIQKYTGKIVVIKYGGNAMTCEQRRDDVMRDIVLLSLVGIKVVLVHGGGPEINQMLAKLGIESKFIGGLRYTDRETVDVVQMVLAGKVNKDLVALLGLHRGRSLGLCGLDGGMIKAEKKVAEQDLGFVGEITGIDTSPITDALQSGYIPVIATLGLGEDGSIYNINADTAAAEIAAALGAETLTLMTDIKGLLHNKEDASTLIPEVNVSEVPYYVTSGVISGGMLPKVECCVTAIRRGVKRAFITDGREPHSILVEMLSDKGVGTMFK